jgi:signal peptide peptidase SppA
MIELASVPLWALAPGHSAAVGRAPAKSTERPNSKTVGLIELVGTLDKAQLLEARARLNRLAREELVGEILVLIDSPGGTVAGTADLAEAVFRTRATKPIHAFIEDTGASAAYWIASQATSVTVNRTAAVGSIGVFQVVVDASELMEKTGIRIIVVRSGARKGLAAAHGARVTPEQLADLQARVDAVGRVFVADVARGRGVKVEQAQDWSDGRVLTGAAAVSAGLADRVGVLEELWRDMVARTEHLSWNQLTCREAAEKFAELVAAEPRLFEWESGDAARRGRVAARHPQLAAAAAEYEKWRCGTRPRLPGDL